MSIWQAVARKEAVLAKLGPSLVNCRYRTQCCGSALALMRIRIRRFTSVLIRVQGAKPMLIRIRVRLCRQVKVDFLRENLPYEGNWS